MSETVDQRLADLKKREGHFEMAARLANDAEHRRECNQRLARVRRQIKMLTEDQRTKPN